MHQNGMGRGRGHKNYSRSGPLLTDHLQVRDLDRELEILRHKREVVQRELTFRCDMDRKRQYEHINRKVSNTYGNVWQPHPPKRAPLQPNPWTGTTQDSLGPNMSKSLPANYIPSLMSKKFNPPGFSAPIKPIVHPMLKNTATQKFDRPTNVRKDFRPTNIIKKKIQKNPPNKLNSYPVKERKNLVLKATESQLSKYKANKPPEDSANLVLRENQTPNNQVNGRLELALGSIVKEIRSSNIDNETFKTLVVNPKYQRIMKQAVRERIRTVMLNKTVGPVLDIVKQYRQKFSKASDKDIVELVINSEHHNLETVIETDNPEEFFKKNIASILEKKIQEMAMKLLKMCERRRPTNVKTADDGDKKPDEKESILDSETSMKVIRGLTGKYVTVEEKNALTKYYTELIENILEEKLPEYLPKCADQFLKIFDLDHQFKTIKRMATERVRNEIEGNKTEDNDLTEQDEQEQSAETSDMKENDICDNNEIEEKEDTETTPTKEVTTEIDEVNETTEITPVPMDAEESASIPKASKAQQQETSKNAPSTPLEKNTESPETIKPTTPLAKKTETADTVTPKKPVAKTIESASTTVNTPVTPSVKELPYYVKLIGRPKLPNRADICDFLSNYKPNSIKKHKSISNLLVVGFVNQEDYDKILLANETVIGDITIIIKASEKVTTGKENESINEGNNSKIDTQDDNNASKETRDGGKAEKEAKDENEISKETADTSNKKNLGENKDLIGKELDDQISDLLCTIKQVDENNDNSKKITPLETIKEGEDGVKTAETQESEKVDKITKASVKESGRATPVRSSSRLGNVTPSTIRTRRASRLMQE